MIPNLEWQSHVEVLVHKTLDAIVSFLFSLPLHLLHCGFHLQDLLLVSLDKAVPELGGEVGGLLHEGVAVKVGREAELIGKPRHLPHLLGIDR